MGRKGEPFLLIEIGSSKISGVLGEIKDRDMIIHSSGFEPTTGISAGVVVSIDETKTSIKRLLRRLKVKGVKMPKSASVLITGSHLRNRPSKGITTIGENNHKERLISRKHVENALKQAKEIHLPKEEEIVSIFPSAYYVNDKPVKKPYNMMGVRLEVDAFVLTADTTHLGNIEIALLSSNIRAKEYLYQPIMASYGALINEDRDTGVILIDIGKDTTDIAVWEEGTLIFTKTLETGGQDITNDIAQVLHLRKSDAEKLKLQHGTCDTETVDKKSTIPIEVFDGDKKVVSKKELADIIRARVEDIFLEVRDELRKNHLFYADRKGNITTDIISIGVVLTGGTSLLPGIKEVGKEIFKLPCNIGSLRWKKVPQDMNTPSFASLWGAVEYKYEQLKNDPMGELDREGKFEMFIENIKDFFKTNI